MIFLVILITNRNRMFQFDVGLLRAVVVGAAALLQVEFVGDGLGFLDQLGGEIGIKGLHGL